MESDLDAPIKTFLEARGYEVKGEIGPCDVVARRGDEAPIVVELKERLTLALVLQAVDRLAVTDTVFLAFRSGRAGSGAWRTRRRAVLALLRRLGLGLLTVSATGRVHVELEPGPYAPRGSRYRLARLLGEFERRDGDPEMGGARARRRMTAYRQAALRCARALHAGGVTKASRVRDETGVARAGEILRRDPYGWFERVERGHYRLSEGGRAALEHWGAAESDEETN